MKSKSISKSKPKRKKMNDTPIAIGDKVLVIPPLGFQNTGAICYFNSLIQCLISSKHFLKTMLSDKYPLFKDFLINITNDRWDMTFTTSLLRQHNIIQANQSSSEYFLLLIDLLNLENLFECQHRIITTCNNCKQTKESTDISYNVLIDTNIEEFFVSNEQVDQVNCDFCHVKSNMERKKVIQKMPPIIGISLNKYFGKKQILYPIAIKSPDFEYSLIGTVEHMGVLGAGHYTSRFMRNGEYHVADDANTRKISELNPVPETYMIFYELISK